MCVLSKLDRLGNSNNMPDGMRIDSFHGFSHMHYFSKDNNHRPIKRDNLMDALLLWLLI